MEKKDLRQCHEVHTDDDIKNEKDIPQVGTYYTDNRILKQNHNNY